MLLDQISAAILRPGNNQFHHLEAFYEQVNATTLIRLTRMRGKNSGKLRGKIRDFTNKKPAKGQFHKKLNYLLFEYWCGWRDLNPHALRHQNLNLACLPISPHPHRRS